MTTSHTHKGYVLHCDPMPMADGRFGSQVVIQPGKGDREVKRHFPAQKFFAAEQDAVEYEKKWGEAWVDKHG